jgi:hypothetical protein
MNTLVITVFRVNTFERLSLRLNSESSSPQNRQSQTLANQTIDRHSYPHEHH